MIHQLQHKKIAVLGFGMEGIATVAYLIKHNIDVTVLDRQSEEKFNEHSGKIKEFKSKGVHFSLGSDYFSTLNDYDIIFRTPGISPLIPNLIEAKLNGAKITSHTQLFLDLCPCPVIGVTGTKGKGTTSSLIYEMLAKEGKDAYIGGNIGKPPLDFLDILSEHSIVVLEMSSFQLQDLTKSPHIAVVLMITSEHLDFHNSHEEYISSKRNIVRFQTANDFAVINRDYLASIESDIHSKGELYYTSRERKCDQGCYVSNGTIWVSKDNQIIRIIDTKDIKLPGRHNWENVCASVMSAVLAGVSKKNIVSVLKTFKGLKHRLEFITEVQGVAYYDDSFSTTPETAIAAIEAFDSPEILILGGSGKNSDFHELGEVINGSRNIKAIIGIGKEWLQIKPLIHSRVRDIEIVEGARTMAQIVRYAADIAEAGDVVILSPGCASFDMFKNYKDRGEQFQKEVLKLKTNNVI